MANLDNYKNFKKDFAELCEKHGIRNAHFNVSNDSRSCYQSTVVAENSLHDEHDVEMRTFKGLIPYLLNSYENMIHGQLDLVRIVMEESEKHRQICEEFAKEDDEGADVTEATDEEIMNMQRVLDDIQEAESLKSIYMDKADFELMKHMARHFRDKKGMEPEEALRNAINGWADSALSRQDLSDDSTPDTIRRNVDLRHKLRKARNEQEKDRQLKMHLGEPLEWK